MATITLTASADVACWTNQPYAAGLGDHLPVGSWSSAVYRSAVRFTAPSWLSWTAITKATLNVYISDHHHVGVRNSTVLVRRQTVANLWTKAAGTQDCENGFSAGNNTQNSDLTSSSTDSTTFSSGTTANAKKAITVTNAVRYYFDNKTSHLVFTFVGNSSSDYTELWSRERGSTYDATLVIEYETQSVPNAPTLVSPAAGEAVVSQTPTFAWTHSDAQGDAQTEATIELYDAAGTTLLDTQIVSGSAQSLVWPSSLTRGTTYQYRVRTSDAGGYGAYSALRTFSIKALPTVTIDPTRVMVYSSGPRLRVKWSVASGTQSKYRITAPGYDTGWITSTAQEVTLTGLAVTDGVGVTITVEVETSDLLQGSDSETFTPRYGLTTHRKDLGSVPLNWKTPTITATIPSGASLVIEYGSSSTASAAPEEAWSTSLASVPKRQYLFYRAWFLPSATASPVLDKIVIPADATVTVADHWELGANGSIDTGEFVYGSRSLTIVCPAGGFAQVNSTARISVRAGRSYILTGLMKSQGDSGAYISLRDSAATYLAGTDVLHETRDWFTSDRLDVYRYKSQVWTAPADMDVVIRCSVQGPPGAQGWFDAVKLEESTVATPWSPGAIGASIVDAGGVQVDGSKGAVLRYKGINGGARDVVDGGPSGLVFGTDTELASPSTGVLAINGVPIGGVPAAPIRRVYTASDTWTKPAGLHHIEVEVVGGGGSSGGTQATGTGQHAASGGGGGGGYARKLFTAADLASLSSATITVGTGAPAPAAGNNNGTTGGTSSFAGTGITTVSGSGGSGGQGGTASSANTRAYGAGGGSASGGDVNVQGDRGGSGFVVQGEITMTAYGGGTALGGSSFQRDSGAAGGPGQAYGGGGYGAAQFAAGSSAYSGGAGADGVVIVTEYYS